MRSLNRELQLHILELADVLIERPSQYARRVEDISLIFKNLHHLLNSLRPHQVELCLIKILIYLICYYFNTNLLKYPKYPFFQARATLIHILELQIQRRKQAVEDIKRHVLYHFMSTLSVWYDGIGEGMEWNGLFHSIQPNRLLV